MNNTIAHPSERRLPHWVNLANARVGDLTAKCWRSIGHYKTGLDRIIAMRRFVDERLVELPHSAAIDALDTVIGDLDDFAFGGIGIDINGSGRSVSLDLHWPGAFSRYCEGCWTAVAYDNTLRRIAATWNDHPDYNPDWTKEF